MWQIVSKNVMKKLIGFIKDIFIGLYLWRFVFVIIGVVIVIGLAVNAIFGYKCIVVETGYFHSTNKESKCRFIAIAKQRNYTIERMSEENARKKGYKICKECFSESEQKTYYQIKEFSEHLDFVAKHAKESAQEEFMWGSLKYKNDFNYDSLCVYIDAENVLHISKTCYGIYNKGAIKKKLNDVERINTTCESCVGREYVDFIYKKINEGVYDVSQIKEVEDEEY